MANDELIQEAANELAAEAGVEGSGGLPSTKGEEVPEPDVITRNKSGAFIFKWNLDNGEMFGMMVERVSIRRAELECYLSVGYRAHKTAKTVKLLTRTHWKMRSTNSTSDQQRTLKRRADRQWDARLQQVKAHVEENFAPGDPLIFLGNGAPAKPVTMLAAPFVEERQHTVIAAYGGSTKSLLGLAIAISLATGKSIIPGMVIDRIVKTLYVDYESTSDVHEYRMRMLLAGAGIEWTDELKHSLGYLRLSMPLVDSETYVQEYIAEHDFELIVTDSASRAVGGDTIDETSVMSFFNTISSFGITALTIAHKPKDERSRGPSGNSHWYHQARSYWELGKDQIHGSNTVELSLNHEKSNNGMLQNSIGLQLEFGSDAYTYRRFNAADNAQLAQNMPLVDQIVNYLRENPNQTSQDIAKALDKAQTQVDKTLRQRRDAVFHAIDERPRRWSLITRLDQDLRGTAAAQQPIEHEPEPEDEPAKPGDWWYVPKDEKANKESS